MKEIVYPWDESKFDGTAAMLDSIYANLRRLRFRVQEFREAKPTPLLSGAMESLMPEVLASKWILCCSNSIELLQALAETIPISFSLTTHDSSVAVTTDLLVSKMRWGGPAEEQSSTDLIKQAKVAGILTWMNIALSHESGDRYHSRFADILIKRRSLGFPVVFLAPVFPKQAFNEAAVTALIDSIKGAVGVAVAMLIREICEVRFLEVELKPKEITSIKL